MSQNKLTTPILKSKLKDHKTLKSKLLKLINEAPFPLDQSNNNTYLKKGHNHSFYKLDLGKLRLKAVGDYISNMH